MSKIFYSIQPSSRTSLTFSVSRVAEAPKPLVKEPESQYFIHDGKLYPVRQGVQ
jgi:hypothetical protein